MIEINLLPAEYRPREKTNFPLMATVAVGMLVVGGIILYGIKLQGQLAALNTRHKELSEKKASLESEVKTVRALQAKIARQKARQDTIIEISQSKVMWSLKLQQFAEIMSQYPNFWIQRMNLTKTAKGGSLTLTCSATGSDLRSVARFRDSLKQDPNFAYHFNELESREVRIQDLEPGYNFAERMDFQIKLPLKSGPPKGKRGKK